MRTVVAGAIVLLLAACAPVYPRPGVMAPLDSPNPQVRQGEAVFFEYCHACHPHGGVGVGRGVTDRPLPGFAVRLQIRNGFGQMPAFSEEEISPSELDALMSYLAELREFWATRAD